MTAPSGRHETERKRQLRAQMARVNAVECGQCGHLRGVHTIVGGFCHGPTGDGCGCDQFRIPPRPPAAPPPVEGTTEPDWSRYELAYIGLGLPLYCRPCNERLDLAQHVIGEPGVIPFDKVLAVLREHETSAHRSTSDSANPEVPPSGGRSGSLPSATASGTTSMPRPLLWATNPRRPTP